VSYALAAPIASLRCDRTEQMERAQGPQPDKVWYQRLSGSRICDWLLNLEEAQPVEVVGKFGFTWMQQHRVKEFGQQTYRPSGVME
jgi:hypothetical protein